MPPPHSPSPSSLYPSSLPPCSNPFSAQHDGERGGSNQCCSAAGAWPACMLAAPRLPPGRHSALLRPPPLVSPCHQATCATMPPAACRASWTPPARWWRCTSTATCLASREPERRPVTACLWLAPARPRAGFCLPPAALSLAIPSSLPPHLARTRPQAVRHASVSGRHRVLHGCHPAHRGRPSRGDWCAHTQGPACLPPCPRCLLLPSLAAAAAASLAPVGGRTPLPPLSSHPPSAAYCTASGNVVCVSRGFGNVLGWAAEDVIGKASGGAGAAVGRRLAGGCPLPAALL